MIIFDIEWNTGYKPHALPEILQIGAVRFDRLSGKIKDTFCCYIKPTVNKKWGYFTKFLPNLDDSALSSTEFPEAYSAFQSWCGTESDFAAWGNEDFKVIQQNCRHYNIDFSSPDRIYDLQRGFSIVLQTEKQISLSDAVEYLGLPEPFEFHNALHDSVYTAIVSSWIPEDVLNTICIPRSLYKLSLDSSECTKPQRRRIGPYSSVDSALNRRGARRQKCPVCERPIWTQSWYYSVPGTYYSLFECPEHGKFPCRLCLSKKDDDHWYGKVTVSAMTPEYMSAYQMAHNGMEYRCKPITGITSDKPAPHSHRRRRKSKTKSKIT